jgi:hypothetical protein
LVPKGDTVPRGRDRTDEDNVIEDARLWHVTVTVSGTPMEPLLVRGALHRLSEQRPFISALRFNAERAEITYWDEADSLVDAASLGLRLWDEYRDSARLPSWEVIGLEVVERDLKHSREQYDPLADVQVAPQSF